ncbi:lipopolysaccharide biosynthesis protein [Colwelliaceae bacterium 6441]
MRTSTHFKRFLSANFLVAFFGVITGVILARNLSVADRGELAEILLWTSLGVTIGSESIREYLLSFKNQNVKVESKVLLLASIITILLPFFLLFDNDYYEYVGYSFLFGLINLISISYLAKVQVKGDFANLSLYKVIVPLVNLVILIATFFYDLGIWFALFSLLIANTVLLVKLIVSESLVEVARHGKINNYIHVLFSIIVITIINQMDRIVIAKVAGPEEMAYFVISLTIVATPLTIIGQSISSYMVIDIKKRKSDFNKYIDKKFVITLLLLGIIAGIIYFFSNWIISTVFGEKYLPAIAYGVLCSCFAIFTNIRTLYNYALRGLGLNKLVSILQLLMLSTLFVLYFVYLNYKIDVKSLLWLLISMQFTFFVGFYLYVRNVYLSNYHNDM